MCVLGPASLQRAHPQRARPRPRRYNTQLTGINGGVIMLRPCPAVQRHMVSLLDAHAKLRFSHGAAEQDFFTWYFRFDGMMLVGAA